MIESVGDFISLVVSGIFTVIGLYCLFVVTDRHHEETMKRREEKYYSYLESLDDEYDDMRDEPYYE